MTNLLTVSLFLSNAAFSGFGLLLLKIAMNEGNEGSLSLLQVVSQFKFLAGFVLYVLGFLSWMFILSKFDVNVAFPISISLFFIVVTMGSYVFLHETVGALHIMGIMMCLVGILLINIRLD